MDGLAFARRPSGPCYGQCHIALLDAFGENQVMVAITVGVAGSRE